MQGTRLWPTALAYGLTLGHGSMMIVPMRRHPTLLILLLLAASPPVPGARSATAKSTTLRLQAAWAWNRHASHGADGARHDSAVTITLDPGGQCTVLDSGTAVSTVLYRRQGWFKEEKTTWTTRWQGTWRQTGDHLRLVVARRHRDCDRTETWRGSAPKRLTCASAPTQLILDCAASVAPLVVPHGVTPAREPVWRCAPVGSITDVGGTPVPWVLGRDRCLRGTGGRPFTGPPKYAPCAP